MDTTAWQSSTSTSVDRRYLWLLYWVSGFGGLLLGIDLGIVSGALPYINQTISLTVFQSAVLVSAVLGGGFASTPLAGLCAEWLGRKRMMVASGVLFMLSIVIIIVSQAFVPLLIGRFIQGASSGFMSVIVPLYIVETVNDRNRGRATTMFQFLLTAGILLSAMLGLVFTRMAEHAIADAQGDQALIHAAATHAWHSMFLVALVPGVIFTALALMVSESPRWLLRRGRTEQARRSLARLGGDIDARFEQMTRSLAQDGPGRRGEWLQGLKALCQRRYVIPFVLACLVLALTQATGINSILSYLVVILQQAGFPPVLSTSGDVIFKAVNVLITIAAFFLVDRLGRKFLLALGTGVAAIALLLTAALFYTSESEMVDVTPQAAAAVQQGALDLQVTPELFADASALPGDTPKVLTLVYRLNSEGEQGALHMKTVTSDANNPVFEIKPAANQQLDIFRARLGNVPSRAHGWWVLATLCLFVMAFAVGPGVIVWLMLTELMPNRIRSIGMGVALFLNNGTSTALATLFLPIAGRYGMSWNFVIWAGFSLLYFVIALRFIPETRGRSLEDIEEGFAHWTFWPGRRRAAKSAVGDQAQATR